MTRLEPRLAALAASGETTTYGALARDLGLRVAELAAELETLMEMDRAANRALRASLLNARGSTLPARGFFDKAAELGFDISDRAAFTARQRRELFAQD